MDLEWDAERQRWVTRPGPAAPPPPVQPPPPPALPPRYPPEGQPQADYRPPDYPKPGNPQPDYPPHGQPQADYPPHGQPQAEHPPPEGPSAGRPRPRALVLAAVAGVLVGGIAGGGWYLLSLRADGKPPANAGTSTSPSPVRLSPTPTRTTTPPASPVPTSPAPTPTPTSTSTPTTGLTTVQDAAGFTLTVPEGWRRRADGTSVFYDSPDGTSLIQVFVMGDGAPYDQAAATDSSLAGNPTRFPGYRRIRLEVTAGGAADLEYAYDPPGRGTRRVVDHVLTAPDGKTYALLVAGPAEDWPALLQHVQQSLVTSWCLTGRC
ncbi:hypothetical protein ACWCXH_03585 [Kitasatospora sp. NPDC001660]